MLNIFSFLRRGLQMRRNFSTTCTTLGTRGEADAALCTRDKRPENGADEQPCLSDVYKNSTRAKRRQADVPLCGRSMVEMLGVLAIIGVLSVGAMSGYAKAMEKYKINKIVQNHGYFIARLVEHENLKEEGGNIAPYFDKLGLFPGNFTISNDGTVVESDDVVFRPFVRSNFVIDYYLSAGKLNTFKTKLCASLVLNLAIPLHESIRMIWIYRGEGNSKGSAFYGDSECTGSKTCLKDVKLNDIKPLCSECIAGSSCTLTFELF